jgi:hypothetical protein
MTSDHRRSEDLEMWELSAREKVRDTIAEYAFAVDRPSLSWITQLFSEDGVLEIVGQDRGVTREGLAQMFRNRAAASTPAPGTPYAKHVVGSIRFIDVQPHRIEVRSYFVRFDRDRAIQWGTYEDVLVAREARWLIQERRVTIEAAAPGDPLRPTSS